MAAYRSRRWPWPRCCPWRVAESRESDDGEATVGGEMQARLDQFAPVTLGFDESLLDADQRRVVRELVEASRHLDDIFRLQAWRGNAGADALLPAGDDPEVVATREYYEHHVRPVGPSDR